MAISAWTPGSDREPDTFHLSRLDGQNEVRFAGSIHLGLSAEHRQALRDALGHRDTASARRRRVRPIEPGISVVVSTHGPVGGQLRDAIMRDIVIDEFNGGGVEPGSPRRAEC